jgi:hypothetical protein
MQVLSSFFLGESKIWNIQMVVGCTTAILGFCLYSHSKLESSDAAWQPIIKGVPEVPIASELRPLIKE